MVRLLVPSRPGPPPKSTTDFHRRGLYRAKTDIRAISPNASGSWKTVYNRFSNWSLRGHWAAIFKALQIGPDDDGVIIDASIVRAHQDAAGEGGSSATASGSFSRWILHEIPRPRRHEGTAALRRAHARPAARIPTVAAAIIENHARGEAFIADTGYDSDAIRDKVKSKRMKPVIHANPTRKRKPRLDRRRYASRYRVEIFFHDLKRFRALATRFEKTSRNYLALIHLACSTHLLQDLVGAA